MVRAQRLQGNMAAGQKKRGGVDAADAFDGTGVSLHGLFPERLGRLGVRIGLTQADIAEEPGIQRRKGPALPTARDPDGDQGQQGAERVGQP